MVDFEIQLIGVDLGLDEGDTAAEVEIEFVGTDLGLTAERFIALACENRGSVLTIMQRYHRLR